MPQNVTFTLAVVRLQDSQIGRVAQFRSAALNAINIDYTSHGEPFEPVQAYICWASIFKRKSRPHVEKILATGKMRGFNVSYLWT